MSRLFTSIVGKLWVTILLLVSFVLFIFMLFMLEFLETYHTEQAEMSLRQTAATIANITEQGQLNNTSIDVIEDILGEYTNAIIVSEQGDVMYAAQTGFNQQAIQQKIIENEVLQAIYSSKNPIVKELIMPSQIEEETSSRYVILAYPLQEQQDVHGAIFIYQNPEAIFQTSKETAKIVLIAAAIAFVLTTIFAFFLSSKITLPLRKMREHAFDISKGKFDSRLKTEQNDEIGQLAVAFNQMGRQLKNHVEVINQEKEQVASILTSMTDAVITFNRDRTILISNPPAEKLLQKWFVVNGSQSARPIPAEIYHMLDHVLDLEDKIEEELEIGSAYYSISISPLYSEEGVRGAVAVIRDQTEEHRLEKLKSDFIANVSHELRTPIAMLQGYSEAILDDVVTEPEEQKEMIRIIYDESQRMSRLVSDLLDLAKMESGNIVLYKNWLPIVPVLERMTYKFAQVAKEKDVHLNFDAQIDELTEIEMDEDRIEQVLTNLIDNALRHTPAGQSVTVRLTEQAGFIQIDIADTGQGIPKEDLAYVFERFYKADKARTRSKGGTGLGLAIASHIVEAHRGTITVTSEVGVGTTFTFYLPI